MTNAFFSDLMTSIAERGRSLLDRRNWTLNDTPLEASEVAALCEALLSVRGEASGAVIAREALDGFARLPAAGKADFFESLARDFGPDREKLAQAISAYSRNPDAVAASNLHYLTEPRRQELFRRMNRASGGAKDLVAMRADLLTFFAATPISRRSTAISCTYSFPGSIRAFSCCVTSTGERPLIFSKKSFVMKPCIKSATGTNYAAASIRRTAVATPSFIRLWWTNR